MAANKKLIVKIDATPSWQEIVPALIALIEGGGAGGRTAAIEEIKRMAKIADAYVATTRAEGRQS